MASVGRPVVVTGPPRQGVSPNLVLKVAESEKERQLRRMQQVRSTSHRNNSIRFISLIVNHTIVRLLHLVIR